MASDDLTAIPPLARDCFTQGNLLLRGIAWGTLIAGALDITAAIVTNLPRGIGAMRVLQSVAGGLLGRASFAGGAATAALGLLLHFLIMSVIVAIYVLMSRRYPVLVRHAVTCGIAYGIAVFAVMTYIVVPLSAIGGNRLPASVALTQLAIHIVCVGLPIASVARKFVLPQTA